MQKKIQLTLELPEVNQILAGLGKLSYEDVYQLIDKIKEQAQGQLQHGEPGRLSTAAMHDAEDTQ